MAAIGNVVAQLHVHVVGRRPDDFCWPGVVWGAQERRSYTEAEAAAIAAAVGEVLGEAFVPPKLRPGAGPGSGRPQYTGTSE